MTSFESCGHLNLVEKAFVVVKEVLKVNHVMEIIFIVIISTNLSTLSSL
jgi:hypothetical protein